MVTLDEMMDRLSPEDREIVEREAKALIAEELSLQALRKARRMTQPRATRWRLW